MTRRFILTTATLAAFLAAGTPLIKPVQTSQRREPAMDLAEALVQPPGLIEVGEHLVAVHTAGLARPGAILGVSLFVQPDTAPAAIQVWAGIKNGWGSQPSRCEAVPGASGLHVASVTVPDELPDHARLWIGIERNAGRPGRASVPLPQG